MLAPAFGRNRLQHVPLRWPSLQGPPFVTHLPGVYRSLCNNSWEITHSSRAHSQGPDQVLYPRRPSEGCI